MLNARKCADCGGALRFEERTQKFQYGQGDSAVELTAVVPVWICETCNDAYTDDKAEEIRHEAVCAHLGRLSPSQIKSFRQHWDMTQEDLAKLTGFGAASIKRWEASNQIQNESADRFLRLVFSNDSTMNAAAAIAGASVSKPKFVTDLSDEARQCAAIFKLRAVV